MSPEPFTVWTSRDPAAFLQQAEAWLSARAANYNLILGLAHKLVQGESFSEQPPWFAVLRDAQGEIACLCMRTPPWRAIITHIPEAARQPMLELLSTTWPDLNGLNGPVEPCDALAQAWSQRHGVQISMESHLRLYTLHEVIQPPHPVPGELRPFPPQELPLLVDWLQGFHEDAHLQDARGMEALAQRSLETGRMHAWVVQGRLVSMAVAMDAGICARISYVYTPPAQRRRGYASAMVAALSQAMLDRGYRFCSLYTDLTNPTSNKIYQEIGYRAVEDTREWTFRAVSK